MDPITLTIVIIDAIIGTGALLWLAVDYKKLNREQRQRLALLALFCFAVIFLNLKYLAVPNF